MAPKSKRNHRRNRSGFAAASTETVESTNSAPSVAAKRERRSKTARSRRQSRQDEQAKLIQFGAIAIGVLLLALVGWGVAQFAFGNAGSVTNFDFAVYQGEEELGGSEVNFNDLIARNEPIILNFWAGDCPPCRAEMPALQKVYDQHRDDLIFLGLDVGVFTGLGTKQSALDLLEELNITYPAGAPPNSTAMINYSVRSMPTTIFIGGDGQIFQRWDGSISERQMNDIVEAMLEQSS